MQTIQFRYIHKSCFICTHPTINFPDSPFVWLILSIQSFHRKFQIIDNTYGYQNIIRRKWTVWIDIQILLKVNRHQCLGYYPNIGWWKIDTTNGHWNNWMMKIYILILNDEKGKVQMDIQILDDTKWQCKLCQQFGAHNWTVEMDIQISDNINGQRPPIFF